MRVGVEGRRVTYQLPLRADQTSLPGRGGEGEDNEQDLVRAEHDDQAGPSGHLGQDALGPAERRSRGERGGAGVSSAGTRHWTSRRGSATSRLVKVMLDIFIRACCQPTVT